MSGKEYCSECLHTDSSAATFALVDTGPAGRWATAAIIGSDLIAPHLAVFEVANLLRRHELAGLIGGDQAAEAHADLLDLAIELWPYDLLAPRAWELRHNLSTHDASYVALAEVTGATLVTLDTRIAGDRTRPADQRRRGSTASASIP